MIISLLHLLGLTVQRKSCIVFFSGGSNLISPNIYSDFLTKFDNKYKIYKLPVGLNSDKLINELDTKYNNIVYMGHSSGCTTAINKCNNKVKQLILLDPVKTSFYQDNKNLNYLDSVLFIHAEKSYKWSKIPPFIPFIPFFKVDPLELNINKNKILVINVNNYGHCDIINNPFRNLMHYTRISVGNNKRRKKYINVYHNFLCEHIITFVNKTLPDNLHFI